jgi:CobQ-like glutamine amidotransferase family enzyme
LFPELLGTYGDRGNAIVLRQRLLWRGIDAEMVTVSLGTAVPTSCDVYLLGGGEDGPQSLAASELGRDGVLARAVDGGAAVFAVCAGLQILGQRFVGPDGKPRDGLGLLDCITLAGPKRAIGELLADPDPASSLPTLTGYENHGGRTTPGPTATTLGRVRVGCGNGDGTEGVVNGRVMGTYLHGPGLARNPALADLVLGWVAGPLDPLPDEEVAALRAERIAAVKRPRPSWRR